MTKDVPVNTPNLHIWNLASGESVKCYVQKKHTGWEPSWSCDEKLLARNLNLELQVYETDKLESMAQKMTDIKVADFSISPAPASYYFLCYVQGISNFLTDYNFSSKYFSPLFVFFRSERTAFLCQAISIPKFDFCRSHCQQKLLSRGWCGDEMEQAGHQCAAPNLD